jgi:hypothetical protein
MGQMGAKHVPMGGARARHAPFENGGGARDGWPATSTVLDHGGGRRVGTRTGSEPEPGGAAVALLRLG